MYFHLGLGFLRQARELLTQTVRGSLAVNPWLDNLQFICFPKLDNLAAATFSIALLITGYSFNISLKSSTSRLYKEHIVTAKIEATRRPFVKSRIS